MSAILITNIDTSKIFVWDNRFQKCTYTNSTGSTVNLLAGRIMGRVTTGQKVLPQVAAAVDGSAQPMGVLADNYTVANGATITVYVCDGGDVAEEKLLFNASETLATVITDDVSIRSAIERNTQIKLVAATELLQNDNN